MALEDGRLSTLFVAHRDELRRHVARKLSCPEDIEDIVQEVFLRAHRAFSSHEISEPRAYLHQIAASAVADYFRRRQRRGRSPDALGPIEEEAAIPSTDPTPEELAICEQTWCSLCGAIERLPPQARRAVILSKVGELTCREVARSMGISARTVEKHLARGLGSLRVSMQISTPGGGLGRPD